MSSRYRPLFGRVLIERQVTKKTRGGILLPDDQQKRHAPSKGKIAALGDTAGWTRTYDEKGEESLHRTIKIGDEVMFGRHAGAWLDSSYTATDNKEDDAPYFLCQDEDLLAVIETEN